MPKSDNLQIQLNKQQNVFNLIKGLACICVVFIHVRFPGIVGDVIWKLSQYAVPTFLMISGYFAYQKDEIVVKKTFTEDFENFSRFFCLFFCL